jgi:hypothetical protein
MDRHGIPTEVAVKGGTLVFPSGMLGFCHGHRHRSTDLGKLVNVLLAVLLLQLIAAPLLDGSLGFIHGGHKEFTRTGLEHNGTGTGTETDNGRGG